MGWIQDLKWGWGAPDVHVSVGKYLLCLANGSSIGKMGTKGNKNVPQLCHICYVLIHHEVMKRDIYSDEGGKWLHLLSHSSSAN